MDQLLKRTHLPLIDSFVDDQVPLSKRLPILHTISLSLSEPIKYYSQDEKSFGQKYHFNFWRYILAINKSMLEDAIVSQIHKALCDLIQLPEFSFTENNIETSDFTLDPNSNIYILFKEYRNYVWNTLLYALSLTSHFLSLEFKRFISKILGFSIIIFPYIEQFFVSLVYSISPRLNCHFNFNVINTNNTNNINNTNNDNITVTNNSNSNNNNTCESINNNTRNEDLYKDTSYYDHIHYDEDIFNRFSLFYTDGFILTQYPSYIKTRYCIDKLFYYIINESSYCYRKKFFIKYNPNIFGWRVFMKFDEYKFTNEDEIKSFLITDNNLLLDTVSSLVFRLYMLYPNDMIPLELYEPFFIIYRSVMPIIQATIISRYSIGTDIYAILPTDWYASSIECSKFLLLYPHTINFLLRFIFQPCNIYNYSDINMLIQLLTIWFSFVRSIEKCEVLDCTLCNFEVLFTLIFDDTLKFPFVEHDQKRYCMTKEMLVEWIISSNFVENLEDAHLVSDIFLSNYQIVKQFEHTNLFYLNKTQLHLVSKLPDGCLPSIFDYTYFRNVMKILMHSDTHQTILLAISLLYNYFEVFCGSKKKLFIVECILDELFPILFYHWNHDVRMCYDNILIYKLFQTPRAKLPYTKPDDFLKEAKLEIKKKFELSSATTTIFNIFVGAKGKLSKIVNSIIFHEAETVFDRALENESDAQDLEISSKVDSLIIDVCHKLADPNSNLDPILRKQSELGLRDYVDCLKLYYQKVDEEGIKNIKIPCISYSFSHYQLF